MKWFGGLPLKWFGLKRLLLRGFGLQGEVGPPDIGPPPHTPGFIYMSLQLTGPVKMTLQDTGPVKLSLQDTGHVSMELSD